jgi:putative ABC transport system substrate-binding protein
MAFAPDLGELAQRMANDVHQIFNGIKPGDIPYFQPGKFLLIINLRTAKTLGLAMPSGLLVAADVVIE